MVLQLIPSEVEQFTNALLSAFPNPKDLEQLVYFRLEISLNQIIASGPYSQVVSDLVIWANAQGKVELLLAAARTKNPGNPQLCAFEVEVCTKYGVVYPDDKPILPQKYPSQRGAGQAEVRITLHWRDMLIDVLIKLPVIQSFSGRTSLLHGIPDGGLQRDPGNTLLDLTLIIDQLELIGPLDSGQWPLLLLIDNALPFARGFQTPMQDLLRVRKMLEDRYKMR